MSYANIVHNNSPYDYGVVYVYGVLYSLGGPQLGLKGSGKMMYCIFKNNHNYLFCVYQGSLEVYHSFINHSASFSRSTSVSKYNNSLTNTITYQLQFFNDLYCNADIPLIQRSLEETVRETLKETQRETVGRTYDSECEMRMLSSDLAKRKSDMYMYPIFISIVIV